MSIKYYPESSLTTPCNEVNFTKTDKAQLEALYKDLCEHMVEYQGIGIAANQIGNMHKVCVIYSEKFTERFFLLINPKIIKHGKDNIKFEEGCLSFPGVKVEKERHKVITISYQDIDGNSKEVVFKNLEAVCAQHEIDHLNGITFVDHFDDNEKEKVSLSVQDALKDK